MTDSLPDGDLARVLLVDDRETRDRLRAHDDWADLAVESVGDAAAARTALEAAAYDAVVLDPASLRVDGGPFVETVRDHHPDTPVVVYTATPHADLPDEVRSAADSLVEKGVLADSATFLRRKIAGFGAGDAAGPGPLESYEVLVEAARDGIYVLDATGTFRYLNESLASMLGHEPGTLVGAHASTVMAPGELETGQAIVREVLEGDGTESEVYDMELVTKAGDTLVVGTHFTVITDGAGAYEGIVGVMRDVTERRRHERELARQRERLEEFTGIVAHDLRNPLAAAQAALEAHGSTGDDEHVGDALDAIGQMDALVDDLLTLAKVGDVTEDAATADVARVAEAAFDRIDAGHARLLTDAPGSVDADRDRLLQLLENLLRNVVEHGATGPRSQAREDAVDHGGPGVTVTVGSLEDDRDGFYVADDGAGIPPDQRERVLEHGVTTSADGTGFGLSIVQAIAEAHGWTLRVAESDDGGARFEVAGADADPVF